jgi:hypothetical protein
MADILSPTEYAIVCQMTQDQGFAPVLRVTVLSRKGQTLALYCIPDGAEGWRKLYHRRPRSNGVG